MIFWRLAGRRSRWFRSIARDFPVLDKVRDREFVGKVFDGMSGLDLQDLPSLVYQLLVLASSSRGFDCTQFA